VTFPEDELGVFEESLPARYGGVFDDVALDFVRGLLELNPRQRRTGAACLEHPYFQGLR
jgi:serine/threonine protein kinase